MQKDNISTIKNKTLRTKHFLVLFFILTTTCLLVISASIFLLYNNILKAHQHKLELTTQNYVRHIESRNKINKFSKEDKITFQKLKEYTFHYLTLHSEYHEHPTGTGEYVVGFQFDGDVYFLQTSSHQLTTQHLQKIPWGSEWAAPLQQALQGHTGMMIASDYKGARVLAAFQPIQGHGMGFVSKINLDELQEPFINIWIALLLTFIVALILFWLSNKQFSQINTAQILMQTVIEGNPTAIFLKDIRGTYIQSNKAAEKIFNISTEAIIGKRALDIFSDELVQFFESSDLSLLTSKKKDQLRVVFSEKGQERTIQLYKLPILNTKGICYAICEFIVDITSQISIEQQRQKYEASIEKQIQIKTQNLQDIIESLVNKATDYRRAEQENINLTGQLLTAQDLERQRIAYDLHDQLAQDLASAKLFIDQVGSDEDIEEHNRDHLIKASTALSQSIQFTRNLSSEYLLPKLESTPYTETIINLCEETFHQTKIKCITHLNDFENFSISRDRKYHTYRMLQELLRNIVKHSNATQVEVRAQKKGTDVILEIKDNAIKNDHNQNDSRSSYGPQLGLFILESRAKLINATLTFTPASKQGYLVQIVLHSLK